MVFILNTLKMELSNSIQNFPLQDVGRSLLETLLFNIL